jgi:tetratricopeptide (TPR) repeat protein
LLFAQGRYQEALTSYSQAVQRQPSASRSLIGQAATLNKLGQPDLALQTIEAALQGDGDWGDISTAFVWDQRAQALGGLGQYDEALAAANRAVGLDPTFAPAWSNRAVILWHLEDYETALASTERAIALDDTYQQAWFNQGRILSSLEQYREALVAYDRASQIATPTPPPTSGSTAPWCCGN